MWRLRDRERYIGSYDPEHEMPDPDRGPGDRYQSDAYRRAARDTRFVYRANPDRFEGRFTEQRDSRPDYEDRWRRDARDMDRGGYGRGGGYEDANFGGGGYRDYGYGRDYDRYSSNDRGYGGNDRSYGGNDRGYGSNDRGYTDRGGWDRGYDRGYDNDRGYNGDRGYMSGGWDRGSHFDRDRFYGSDRGWDSGRDDRWRRR